MDNILRTFLPILTVLSTILGIYKTAYEIRKTKQKLLSIDQNSVYYNSTIMSQTILPRKSIFKRALPWLMLLAGLMSIIPTCFYGMRLIQNAQSIYSWLNSSNDPLLTGYLYYAGIAIILIYVIVTFFLLPKSKVSLFLIVFTVPFLVYSMKNAFDQYSYLLNLFDQFKSQARLLDLYSTYNDLVLSLVICATTFYFALLFFYIQRKLRNQLDTI